MIISKSLKESVKTETFWKRLISHKELIMQACQRLLVTERVP